MKSATNELMIGDIFTPVKWGKFAIEKCSMFKDWMKGATIFDPTMGEGNLLESLVEYGKEQGYSLHNLPIKNLFGSELHTVHFLKAINKFNQNYHVDMSCNFINADFLEIPQCSYDIIFGNPPWKNFTDLPNEYKKGVKEHFLRYKLVRNKKALLLGGSRIDIASLIIQRSMMSFLKDSGQAVFFLPLSLFLNEGVHDIFRECKIGENTFAIKTIYDLKDTDVFPFVTTRHGLAYFIKGKNTSYPIPYWQKQNNHWIAYEARPILSQVSPLSIMKKGDIDEYSKLKSIYIPKESQARQGVNTCGANTIFFFDNYQDIDKKLCMLNNKIILPKKFIYPLLVSHNFKLKTIKATKWVLLPYNEQGKPLDKYQMLQEDMLYSYLTKFKSILENRKGVILNSYIKKDLWWAMLGVGKYNFTPYKVVWEAYGRKKFSPIISHGRWQVNQSLQAYIPCPSLREASRIIKELQNPVIEKYLLSMQMEGTMNWAQPGKINKLLTSVK